MRNQFTFYKSFDECLISFPKSINLDKFINTRAIYFLLKDKEVVYVGQTINLANRIKAHKKCKRSKNQPIKRFDTFKFLEIEPYQTYEDMCNIEAEFIVQLIPKYNISIPKNTIYPKLKWVKDIK